MTKDLWIEWTGGKCPVDGDAEVYIKCKLMNPKCTYKASKLDWTHDGDDMDIIAYRLSAEESE